MQQFDFAMQMHKCSIIWSYEEQLQLKNAISCDNSILKYSKKISIFAVFQSFIYYSISSNWQENSPYCNCFICLFALVLNPIPPLNKNVGLKFYDESFQKYSCISFGCISSLYMRQRGSQHINNNINKIQ